MIRILDEVKDACTIAISGHIRPDGDCVGACLAMALFLRKAKPGARVDVFLGTFSESLERNAAGVETVIHDYSTDVEAYDVFICLDCDKDRLGEAVPIWNKAKKKINIDHHQSNPGCGDVNYVVSGASSACELVYDTMDVDGTGKGLLDEPIARDLYIGMVTDTGVFMYSNTSRKTMETAGRMMEFGFDFPAIVREVFNEKTYVQQQILGRALVESIRFMDDRCIFSVIDKKTMEFYKALSSDVDGIASQLIRTHGCVCAVFIYELKPMTYKVSMRSTGEVDCARVCETFGGGGHARAAGCTVNAKWHDIINKIAEIIEDQLTLG